MATLFSHFWICQFDEITGQHLHILNWPYTTAKWCGDKPSWFLDFVEWENQNGVQIAVQMCQIYKLPNEMAIFVVRKSPWQSWIDTISFGNL